MRGIKTNEQKPAPILNLSQNRDNPWMIFDIPINEYYIK